MKKATLALVILVVVAVLAAAVFVSIAARDRAIFGAGEDCACGAGVDDDYDMYNYAGPGDGFGDFGAGTAAGDDIHGDGAGYGERYGGAERLFRLPAREPWYSAIVAKKGGVLLRLARPPFTTLAKGAQVQFVRSRPLGDTSTHATPRCTATIANIEPHKSFVAALDAVGLGAAPGAKASADGAAMLYMDRARDEPAEREFGVFAITLKDVKPEAPRAGAPRAVGARRLARRKIKRGRAEPSPYGEYGAHVMHDSRSASNVFDSVWAS